MRQVNNKGQDQARTQEETILGIQIKDDVVHRLYACGLRHYLGDDADKEKVDEKGCP
jgi:hypothetical protein